MKIMIPKEQIQEWAKIARELSEKDGFKVREATDMILSEADVEHHKMERCGLLLEMGININTDTMEVEFTDAHEDGVDTSLKEPSVDSETIPGVNIYSIFQRNDKLLNDGNPLISALKGNMDDGWKISSQNKTKLLERIRAIIDLFCRKHPMSFTIVIPSGGNINSMLRNMFEEVMKQYSPDNIILDGVIEKMTVDEVEEEMAKPNSAFNKEFNTQERRQKAWEKLRPSFKRMQDVNGGIFSYKLIKPSRYRAYITHVLKFADNPELKEMISKMPDKNILIIDDTVTYGNTTRSAVNLIRDTISNIKSTANTIENYAPKSISVLTLFSVKQYSH
jgi:hypothetical protein